MRLHSRAARARLLTLVVHAPRNVRRAMKHQAAQSAALCIEIVYELGAEVTRQYVVRGDTTVYGTW